MNDDRRYPYKVTTKQFEVGLLEYSWPLGFVASGMNELHN
jgi:hypothetical protein